MAENEDQPEFQDLTFLKLGGSLITDKGRPHTPRPEVLGRLVGEIAAALREDPELRLLLGHGSGSFGHIPASKYGTRQGVRTIEEWRGFVEVWREAGELNRRVMDALSRAGIPAVAFPPSAGVTCTSGDVKAWDLTPIISALKAGLLPVVFGDVVFDDRLGGTILSTEDLFKHLALNLRPQRILLAGIEPGVWADYPACTRLVPLVRPDNFVSIAKNISASASTDVTGGMASKVRESMGLAGEIPGLEIRIFSGEPEGTLLRALAGEPVGTVILGK